MSKARVALLPLLVLFAGCRALPCNPPQSRIEALDRVNNNLLRLQQPLSCSALVSFHFRDADGKEHAFIGHEARLLFQTPQSAVFDVRSLAGTVAQFGSNSRRYWVWIDVPDLRKLWWGTWGWVAVGTERRLPVPPNELFDALMLRPLPESLEGGQPPLLRVDGQDVRLLYTRLGPRKQTLGWREIRVDPCPPYQPLEVIDRLPDGQTLMHAELKGYQEVVKGGPFTPRHYVVRWPQHDAEMRLDILSTKYRSELPEDVFDFPDGWTGDTESVDVTPAGTAQP
ncbi:MAG TPA: hypothetical protein PLQ87_03610 [Phycisphaerae bacterium]|nr:hypothetical protein [Phycisphaerae bacterium]